VFVKNTDTQEMGKQNANVKVFLIYSHSNLRCLRWIKKNLGLLLCSKE